MGYNMAFFDEERGLLDRSVFSSADVFEREQECIFRRSWLFVGAASWVRRPGSYFRSSMGQESVLVWRSVEGPLRIAFDDDRQPSPTFEPRIELYKGLIFASMDPSAMPLASQLGEFAWYLDMILDRRSGGIEAYSDCALSWRLDANWKLPAEAFSGDVYRERTVHAATHAATGRSAPNHLGRGLQICAGGGTIALLTNGSFGKPSGDVRAYERAIRHEVAGRLGSQRARLTPVTGLVFPNLSFDWYTRSLHVWNPLSPTTTGVSTVCFGDHAAPENVKRSIIRTCQLNFGAAGLQTEDDVAPWRAITERSGRLVSRGVPVNLQMGIGRELQHNLPGRVSDLLSEMNQRYFYSWWAKELARGRESATRQQSVA